MRDADRRAAPLAVCPTSKCSENQFSLVDEAALLMVSSCYAATIDDRVRALGQQTRVCELFSAAQICSFGRTFAALKFACS